MNDSERRAWQAWKVTCYTVVVIALAATIAHVLFGV